MGRQLKSIARLSLVLAAVGSLTWLDFRAAHLTAAAAAFTYLLLILGLATKIGRAESIMASLASMIAYDYFFLPPIGALAVDNTQNWITLLAFFASAVITSQLSSTIRARAEEAAAGHLQLQRLYEFSRGLMLTEETGHVADRAAHQLVTAFGARGACVFSATADSIGREGEAALFSAEVMRLVSDTGEPWFDEQRSATIIPIRFGGRPLGSLGVAGAGASEVGLYAVTQLVAAEMERAVAQDAAARMLAAQQSEHLKSVLLDALAHEFKTPLTSIKAAASSMLSGNRVQGPAQELATVINEEADRLTVLVSDAIELARVGSGTVQLQREPWPVEDLLHASLAVFSNRLEDRPVRLECDPNLPLVLADRKLAEIALRQLLANALLYSAPGTPIEVRATIKDNSVALAVSNEGSPVPAAERELLFDKFYRGQNVRGRVAGSGMGLSIARDIAAAHGGSLWLDGDPKRTRFWFTLPVTGD